MPYTDPYGIGHANTDTSAAAAAPPCGRPTRKATGHVMSDKEPLAIALHGFVNDAARLAYAKRLAAENAQRRACGVLLPDERALVFRDLPPVPARVVVSPDALFALLNHAGPEELVRSSFVTDHDAPRWYLTGCNLPLVIEDKLRSGLSFRIEDAEGRGI